MNVAYQCSNSFFEPFIVSLYSLLKNNKRVKELNLYILSKDFSLNNLEKTKNIVNNFCIKNNIEIIKIPDFKKEFGFNIDTYKGKRTQDSFIRLCLSYYLSEDIDRVLYLDSDTLICNSLQEMWELNLDKYIAAAVPDFLSKEYYKFLGLTENDKYFNSGVILFNLKKCRQLNYIDEVKKVLDDKNGLIFFVEQSVFSLVLNKLILMLPLKYNVTSLLVSFTPKQIKKIRNPLILFEDREIIEASLNPYILHMTTFFAVKNRARYAKTNYPRKNIFDSYAKEVSFFTYYKDNRKFSKIITDIAVSLLPKSLLCLVVGRYYNKSRLRKYRKYCNKNILESK